MSKASPFSVVGAAKVKRSAFDLTHVIKTAFWPGQVIPLPPIECIPGDIHRLRFNGVIRLQPMVTPMFENLKLRFYSFFVPYRIIWDQWEDFIMRGKLGTTVVALPTINPRDAAVPSTFSGPGSLWDFFGLQIGDYTSTDLIAGMRPIDFLWRAYWMIWNEFFRIPSLQDEVDFVGDWQTDVNLSVPFYRNWQRDYFASGLPEAQLGVPPALPVFGTASADFDLPYVDLTTGTRTDARWPVWDANTDPDALGTWGGDAGSPFSSPVNSPSAIAGVSSILSDNNTIDGSSFSASDINDLRLSWQLQVWMERNARAGSRYIEQLMSHYRVAPRDERLQRPEFIGGQTTDVVITEVMQTSESTTGNPVGRLAGHGAGIPSGYVGSYRVVEHGLIMNLVCATPRSTYQQGINRSWLRRTTFDFPFPEFAHLGEQPIYNGELYVANDVNVDLDPFAYTGMYNEMRYIQDRVTGIMHSGVPNTMDTWHMSRYFADTPVLGTDFVNMKDALPDMVRPFAVTNVEMLLGVFSVGLDSFRPLPFIAEPSSIGG